MPYLPAYLPSFKYAFPLFLLMSGGGYYWIGYEIDRSQFSLLMYSWIMLFAVYALIVPVVKTSSQLWYVVGASVVFRLLFLGAPPVLSDDFYRYIWDGSLVVNGWNPYLHHPQTIADSVVKQINGITSHLYQNLNSAQYYSVYPPVCQYLFAITGLSTGQGLLGKVVLLRLPLVLAEIGNIVLIKRLLSIFRQPVQRVLWYAANPLVIIVLAGSLHLEAYVVFFLLSSLYLWQAGKWLWSTVPFSFAIGVKFWPILLFPLLLKRWGLRRCFYFLLTVGGILFVLFYPFLSKENLSHLFQSVQLFYQKFEFNASIYYLCRAVGWYWQGYNMIAFLGKGLVVGTVLYILAISLWEKNLQWRHWTITAVLVITGHLLLSTTVHPWYLVPLIALSCFTPFWFPIIWSALIGLSYSAYAHTSYQENMVFIMIEYGLVYGTLFVELYLHKGQLSFLKTHELGKAWRQLIKT